MSCKLTLWRIWGCGGWDGGWGGCKQGWKIFLNYTGRVAADTIRTECIREVLALGEYETEQVGIVVCVPRSNVTI